MVYHEQIDRSVTADAVRDLGAPESVSNEDMETPVFQEIMVEITKKTAYINPACYNFDEVVNTVIQQVCGQDVADWDDFLTEEESNYLQERLTQNGHWMLGYPFFTQYDPREYEDNAKFDTLLFQMDSEMADNREDYVLWGDCGVGNFFIAREDLEKCDFSRVLYNWDCC